MNDDEGLDYISYLNLHRVWTLVSFDKVEIFTDGASFFIDPSTVTYIYDKITFLAGLHTFNIAVNVNGNFSTYRVAYNTHKRAVDAKDQLLDLVRNLESYRSQIFLVKKEVVEEEVVSEPLSFWGRIKFIFNH